MSEKEYYLEGNILVTGGAGFIGSNLTRKLVNVTIGNIVVIDNLALKAIGGRQYGLMLLKDIPENKYKLIVEDASNFSKMKEIIRKENISIVFNLAILPLPLALKKPKYVFDKNTRIASTLAELLRKEYYDVLIHFSSSEVYGSAKYVPMDENHPLEPSTAYGASKAAQDLLLLSYYMTYGVDVRIIRPFNNIGPAQNDFSYSAVVPRTIRRILEGKAPEIYGDGLQTRDFIYVEDTCEAAIRMAKLSHLKGQVVNIASGRETKIKDLIMKICEMMNYSGRIIYRPPRPGDIRRHFASIAKANELLQFRPKYSLEEALAKTIDFYKSVYKNR
ncbi:MAG: GDP-mannose 4,6-dehydratase [Desulfurococcaceae archaeon]